MRKEHTVIVFSVLVALNVWVADAFLSAFVFHDGSFFGRLVFEVPGDEMFMRIVILIGFSAYGIVISNLSARTRQAEETMRRYTHEIDALREVARIIAGDLPVEIEESGILTNHDKAEMSKP